MPQQQFPVTQRLEIARVLQAVRQAGGPRLTAVRAFAQCAVGAWLVQDPTGHRSALTWSPPAVGNGFRYDARRPLLDIVRAAGVPAPAVEQVVELPAGDLVTLAELMAGEPADEVSVELIEDMLADVERRRHLLAGVGRDFPRAPLFLRDDGPGFCLHGPLAAHNEQTRRLLAEIADVGCTGDDLLPGDGIVHFDFHVGNVLVTRGPPAQLSAIVDWDGVHPGDVGLDLMVLIFDLHRRIPGSDLADRVWQRLVATTERELVPRLWAHTALRLVDWAIRHDPAGVDPWLRCAWKYR